MIWRGQVGRKRNSADFGNSAAYFEKLLQTLGNESMYHPMHPALQMDTLQAKLIQLRSANAAVSRLCQVEQCQARAHQRPVCGA